MRKSKIISVAFIICLLGLITGCSDSKSEVILGQYTGLEIEYAYNTVSDKDVENAIIDAIIADQENIKITSRAVRSGDIANINYLGKIDGVAFDGGTAEGHNLEIGSDSFIDGFEDQIIGMKIGQTKDIQVVFPDPYKNNPDLAGANAVFTVKVNSIEGKKIPSKITDAMIKKISDTYSKVKDYRKYMRRELEAQAELSNNQNKQIAAWNTVLANSTIKKLSNKNIKYYANLFETNYQKYAESNGIDLITLIQDYIGITQAEFNAEKQSSALEQAKYCAITDAIATAQGISLSEAEYQSYIDENSVSTDDQKLYGQSIKDELLYQKVLEFITSNNEFIKK